MKTNDIIITIGTTSYKKVIHKLYLLINQLLGY